MELKESKLRKIIREEIYDIEILQNTTVEVTLSFPNREQVSYQELWPLIRILKKDANVDLSENNFVVRGPRDVADELYESRFIKVRFTVNAADMAYALNRIQNLREVSLIGPKKGKMAVESRGFMIYTNDPEEFPDVKLKLTGVSGAMRDERGYNAREAVIRAFINRLQ